MAPYNWQFFFLGNVLESMVPCSHEVHIYMHTLVNLHLQLYTIFKVC